MRVFLPVLFICCAGPAQAMNWEGHDDWMAGMAEALVYQQSLPHTVAVPSPGAPCVKSGRPASPNPYEQIPLTGHDCRAREDQAKPER